MKNILFLKKNNRMNKKTKQNNNNNKKQQQQVFGADNIFIENYEHFGRPRFHYPVSIFFLCKICLCRMHKFLKLHK